MKREKLQDALGMIGEDLYDEENLKTKRKHKKIKWVAVIAAALCLSITLGVVLRPEDNIIKNNGKHSKETGINNIPIQPDPEDDFVFLYNGYLALATYPTSPSYPYAENSEYDDIEWVEFYNEMDEEFKNLGIDLDKFYRDTCKTFFKDTQNKNLIYSPVNIYMALAMLAEISDGESRTQILELTDTKSIDELRTNAKAVWKACYKNDGVSSTVLANSIWLSDNYSYNQETLNTLAEYYYASSFSGECGSEEFNEALRSWLNSQTNGVLKNNVQNIEISPETVITLASTIYFYGKWQEEFLTSLTKPSTFYSPNGNITCDFMNSSRQSGYFWGEGFSAVKKYIDGVGTMYFILPDENISPEDVLNGEEIYNLLNMGDMWENRKSLTVNMSVPKFDVSSSTDIIAPLKELGITEIFNSYSANFSNLTTETDCYAAKIEHSVRVNIDEEGCEAAAYTVVAIDGTSAPPKEEIDFILDRPFIFVITSDANIPLFTGVVNNPK